MKFEYELIIRVEFDALNAKALESMLKLQQSISDGTVTKTLSKPKKGITCTDAKLKII